MAMHVDALKPGSRVLLIDDLLATGGTAAAAAALVKTARRRRFWKSPSSSNSSFLNGREKLKGYPGAFAGGLLSGCFPNGLAANPGH